MPVLNQYRFQCWHGTDVQYRASTGRQLLAKLSFGNAPVLGRAYASIMPVPRQYFKSFHGTKPVVNFHLGMGIIQKQGNWVPCELKPRDVERPFFGCDQLFQRQNRKGFLHRIVTGDEKWVHYDNPKRRKSWGMLGLAYTSTIRSNIHGARFMPCI